jgi:hypothetical protein
MLSVVALSFLAPVALNSLSTSSVSADSGMTIAVSKAKLTSHLLVKVPVTVVCAPLSPDTPASDVVSVRIEQAHVQTVSTGTGQVAGGPLSFFNPSGPPFLNCDGATANRVVVPVLPDQGSSPFHGGQAIVTVNATHEVGTCTPFCQVIASENAQLGPTSIKLGG